MHLSLRLAPMIMAALIVLTGCGGKPLTATVWKQKPKVTVYPEAVSSVLISADKAKIVFLGSKHDYVFNADEKVLKLLDQPLAIRQQQRIDLHPFVVEPDGTTIKGMVNLYEGTPPKLKKTQSIPIAGRRYVAENRTGGASIALSKTYRVQVSEQQTGSGLKALKLLATPVTVAADGTMFLAGAVLLPVVMTFMMTSEVRDRRRRYR